MLTAANSESNAAGKAATESHINWSGKSGAVRDLKYPRSKGREAGSGSTMVSASD